MNDVFLSNTSGLKKVAFILWAVVWPVVICAQQSRKDSLRILRDTARVNYLDLSFYLKTSHFRFDSEDSTYDQLRFFDPAIKQNIVNSSLGNLGTAVQQAYFQSQRREGFDLGTRAFDLYWFTPQNTKYYFTLRPFTKIAYFLGMGSEQLLDVMHTQRITKDLQLGIQYYHINSTGFYQRQDAVHHNFRFFARYQTPNKRYKVLVNYNHNEFSVMESGGLKNDSNFIFNGLITSGGTVVPNLNRKTYPVMLDSALNRWSNNSVAVIHSYSFQRKATDSLQQQAEMPLFTLMHRIQFENRENRFRDARPNLAYYSEILYDSTLSRHRVFLNDVQNEFRAILSLRKKFKSNSPFYAGIRHQFIDVKNTVGFNRGDTLEFDSVMLHHNWHNFNVLGGIRLDITDKILIEAEGSYFFAGYNLNDFHVGGAIEFNSSDTAKIQHHIRAFVSYAQFQPVYGFRFFRSNHYEWSNTFSPQRELRAGLYYSVPLWKLELEFNSYLLNNYMYFDASAHPVQFSNVNSVFTLALQKRFRAWKFFFDNQFIGQYSSSNIIRIPNFIGRFSFYFESYLFKKALFMNFGFDLWYNTPFKANAYNPVTAQFYLQNDQTTGNYPFLDIFLNARIKTVRLYVRLRNVNQRFPDVPYYYTPHHPLQDRSVQFGISWNFYN